MLHVTVDPFMFINVQLLFVGYRIGTVGVVNSGCLAGPFFYCWSCEQWLLS